MIGVMRLNWQVRPTVTGAPSSVPALMTGSGSGLGSVQLMRRASFLTFC